MPGFAFTQLINAPIPIVFAAFSDFEHAADRVTDIIRTEMLTPGPVGVGTKFKETRKVFGKESTETMEVTAFEPNQLIELTAGSCGAEFKSRFTFSPDGPATRVGVEVRTRALSVFARLLTPLAFLTMGMIKACVKHDVEQIKAGIEGAPQPA